MMNKEVSSSAIWVKAIKYFFPLFLFVSMTMFFLSFFDNKTTRQMIEEEEKHGVETEIRLIGHELDFIHSELLFFSNSIELKAVFQDGSACCPDAKRELEEKWKAHSELRKVYDQIRVLNTQGVELIRINYANKQATIVPPSKLQDKSNRYYFNQALSLEKGQIYVSPFDLNIEQKKIELPIKPMIRFGTAVFDKNGYKNGVLILNYLGKKILDKLTISGHLGSSLSMLVNQNGYWLKGMDRTNEWGFMYEDRKDQIFGNYFPEAWNQIRHEKKGQIETPLGLFTFASMRVLPYLEPAGNDLNKVITLTVTQNPEWKIISYLPRKELYLGRNVLRRKLSLIVLFLGLILSFLSWRLAYHGVHRKWASEQKKKQDILVSVLDNAAYGVFLTEKFEKVNYVNQKFTNITGYTFKEISCFDDWMKKAFPEEEYRTKILNAWNEGYKEIKGKGCFDWNAKVVCKNGEIKDVEFRQSSLGKGTEILMLADITERKWAEEERKRLLHETGERVKELRCMYRVAESIRTRVNIDEILKEIVQFIPPGWSYPELTCARICFNGGEFISHPFEQSESCLSTNIVIEGENLGTIEVFHMKECPPFLEEERDLIDGIARTLSEAIKHKLSEKEHKAVEVQLLQSQKMEAVGQLAGGVAHDFNNLLQVIIGYHDLASGQVNPEDPIYEDLNEIKKASVRAAKLVGQLLAFSRRQVLEVKDVNLNDVITNIMKLIRRVIGEHIKLDISLGIQPGIVHADTGQIEQILMNLCVNARDAMPDGGTISLETKSVVISDAYCKDHSWAKPGNYMLVSVSDSGCGMKKETMANIFEPFYTTKEVGKGTGLGLSTVYGLVKQHHGMVHVYSEIDVGTIFKVYLPLSEGIAEEMTKKSESPVHGGDETILIAEDDAPVLKLAKTFLEQSGYTVLTAEDGEKALLIIKEQGNKIDLALVDVVMPKLSGQTVFDKIKDSHPEILVLFASGYSRGILHTGFILNRGLELIQKPYERATLLRKIRKMLDQKQGKSK